VIYHQVPNLYANPPQESCDVQHVTIGMLQVYSAYAKHRQITPIISRISYPIPPWVNVVKLLY
jgi:hypothetical protein